MVGLSRGHDQAVTRGRLEERSFITFYLASGKIIAADAVNRAKDFLAAKRLVAALAQIAPEELADTSRPLQATARTAD